MNIIVCEENTLTFTDLLHDILEKKNYFGKASNQKILSSVKTHSLGCNFTACNLPNSRLSNRRFLDNAVKFSTELISRTYLNSNFYIVTNRASKNIFWELPFS